MAEPRKGSHISLSPSRAMRGRGEGEGTCRHWHLSQVAPADTAGSVAGVSTVAMARSDDSVVERGGSRVRRCLWLRRLRERSVTIGVQHALARVRLVSRRTAHAEHDAWAWNSSQAPGPGLEGRTQKAEGGVCRAPGGPRRRVAGGRGGTTQRRRPREKAVCDRITGCCGGIGKRHSDQHGKEAAGRPCCAPHGVCCATGRSKLKGTGRLRILKSVGKTLER
jgi:hypothetical protein